MKVITMSIIKITRRTVFQFSFEKSQNGEDQPCMKIPKTERMQH